MIPVRSLFLLCFVTLPALLDAQYVLTLRCDGMNDYIGKPFHIRVVETETGLEVGRKTIPSIEYDTLDIELYVLLHSQDYRVDFYIDRNSNNTYDSPPTDHAWRRTVTNPTGNTEISFIPFPDYTDIAFPEDAGYESYKANWGGRWMNQTFGSTDSIEAMFEIACDSIFISCTTAGIFGNPATVSFVFAEARFLDFNPVTDTLHFTVDTPWTGTIYSVNGELQGDLQLMDFGLQFTGTAGQQQVLCQYTVTSSGNPVANGYFYVQEQEVLFNFPPLELVASITPITCAGGNDGSISVEVSGGSGNYGYAWWETGTTTSYVEGLWADTFHLDVHDDLGCSLDTSFVMVDPDSFGFDVYIVMDASCPGVCDALIELDVFGGTPPYSYMDVDSLCSGLYTIFAFDALGCMVSEEIFIVTESDIEVLDIDITFASDGQSNGSATVLVWNGIPPYSYSLDGIQYQADPFFSGLPPGAYSITIMDANGCEIKTDTFWIENITGIEEIRSECRVYPNPVSSHFFVQSDIPVSLDLLDINGRSLKSSFPSVNHEILVSEFSRGLYFLRLASPYGLYTEKLMLH